MIRQFFSKTEKWAGGGGSWRAKECFFRGGGKIVIYTNDT